MLNNSKINIKKISSGEVNTLLMMIFLILCIIEPLLFDFYVLSNSKVYILYGILILLIFIILFNIIIKKNYLILDKSLIHFFLFSSYIFLSYILKPFSKNIALIQILSLILIFILSKQNLKKINFKLLAIAILIDSIIIFIKSFGYVERIRVYTDLYNQNLISLIMLSNFMFISLFIKNIYKKYTRYILMFLAILITIITINNMFSKAMILGLFLFAFFDWFIPKKVFRSKHIIVLIYVLIIVMNFIVTSILLLISKNYNSIRIFLNGRDIIWNDFYVKIINNLRTFLFGFGIDELFRYGNHNSHFDLIATSGIVGYIIYHILIVKFIKKIYKSKITDLQISFLLIFLTFLIVGYLDYMAGFSQSFLIHSTLGFAIALCSQNKSMEIKI